MITKKIEIEFNGKTEIVELKRLSFGEMNQLTEEATDIKVTGNIPIVKVSQKILKEVGLFKSIVSAPFTISLQEIQNLDPDTGKLLFDEFTALNQANEKKNP